MKRTQQSLRKIKLLIVLLLVTIAMIITSTYAWVSTQRDIEISGIRLNVEVAESMQISLDGEKWTQSINIADMRQLYGTYTGEGEGFAIYQAKNSGNTNYVPTELLPVSTVGQVQDGKIQFIKGTAIRNADGTTKLTDIRTCSESDIANNTSVTDRENNNDFHPYFVFDMYLRNISGRKKGIDELFLNIGSRVWIDTTGEGDQEGVGQEATGLEYSARVGMVIYGNTVSVTATDNATQTIGEQIRGLTATNSETAAIWEPNYLNHTLYVVSNNGRGITQLSQEVVTYGIKAEAASATPNEIANTDSTTDANLVAVNTLKANYTTVEEGVIEKANITNTNGEKIGLKPNQISKVRVYIWLEGQDPDCVDLASTGDKLNATLRLTKDESELASPNLYDGIYYPYFFNVNVDDTNLELEDNQAELLLTIKNNDGEENFNTKTIKYKIDINNPDFILKVDGVEIGNTELILEAGEIINKQHHIELIPKDGTDISGNQECNIIVQEVGEYTRVVIIQVTIIGQEPSDEPANPELAINTDYGLVDVIWLNHNTNVYTTTPNAPDLYTELGNDKKLTPVTWTYYEEGINENGKTVNWRLDSTAKSTWYNYSADKGKNGKEENTTSMWANAVNKDGSYFVWIPRYAYRITYYSDSTYTNETGYYDGYGMWEVENGNKKYDLNTGLETVMHNGKSYIVHPAFMKDTNKIDSSGNPIENYARGGWDKNLTGIWVSKYELSRENATAESGGSSSVLLSVPGVRSASSIVVGNMYQMAKTYDTEKESHMLKNSEWGAVAYLTHSQYGKNGHEIHNNNTLISGNGSGSNGGASDSGISYAYNTKLGAKASSTGNIYGIYDLSGGCWEHVAGFNKLAEPGRLTSSSGKNMTKEALDAETGQYMSTKYLTAYENPNRDNTSEAIIHLLGKVGDATKEVRRFSSNTNWFTDNSVGVAYTVPYFGRGGGSGEEIYSGIFYSDSTSGGAYASVGFRLSLAK